MGWGVGVNPIHKEGAIKQPDNYCKITPLYALSKLVDTVSNTTLKYMRQSCKKDDLFQNGFKDCHCTIGNVFIQNGIVEKHKAVKNIL